MGINQKKELPRWSAEEEQIISNPDLTDKEKVTLLPGRTKSAVLTYRKRWGYESKLDVKPFSKIELGILSNPDLTDKERAQLMPGRSVQSIMVKRGRMGFSSKLTGSPWTESEKKIFADSSLTLQDKKKLLPNRPVHSISGSSKYYGFTSKPREFEYTSISMGYVQINTGDGKYVQRCRIVAAEKLGRPNKDDEKVHHINMDKMDDRPENLFVCAQSKHKVLHGALNRIVKQLMAEGVIGFDRESKQYFLF